MSSDSLADLFERVETAKANHDAGRRVLQDLMDELAALAAARLAVQQSDVHEAETADSPTDKGDLSAGFLQFVASCTSQYDALTRLYAEYILKLRAKNEALWAESEGVLARTHQAEAARTALRHDLEALPRKWKLDSLGHSVAVRDAMMTCARDLADRLARTETTS